MAGSVQRKSWRLDDDERRRWSLEITRELTRWLPLQGLVLLGIEYFYDRRDLLFGPDAAPARALNMAGETAKVRTADPFDASRLLAGRSGRTRQLVVVPRLTDSARRAGIKSDDRVALMLANQSFESARSGVLVPARLDRPVKLTLPDDDYTVAGMATRRASLFVPGDPGGAVGRGLAGHHSDRATAREKLVAA